jgi:hypothetical protein
MRAMCFIDGLLEADALGDAMDRLPPDQLRKDAVVPPIARDREMVVLHGPRCDLHHRGHAVRVAWVEPERRIAGRGAFVSSHDLQTTTDTRSRRRSHSCGPSGDS